MFVNQAKKSLKCGILKDAELFYLPSLFTKIYIIMAIQYALQPNPITPDPNDRTAKVSPRESLTLDDVIKRMLRRGTMVTETDMLATLKLFFDVVTDEIADGSAVNLPLVNLKPSIKGVFKDANDTYDSSRHKITAASSPGLLLNKKLSTSKTEKIASSLPGPTLNAFEDINTQSHDAVITPGGIGKIVGEELKFIAAQADEGVFFIDSEGEETRVTIIASLTEGQIMFMIPQLPVGDYTLEVRRAYTSARSIRRGTLDHILTVGSQTEN